MITREDYDMMYTLYTESVRLENRLSVLRVKSGTVQESADIKILEEGASETLKKFIDNILESLQGMINKFRQKVCKDRKDNFFKKHPKKDVEVAIAKKLTPVKVENFREFDTDKLFAIDLKEIHSVQELEGLPDTREEFLKNEYQNTFYKDAEKNIRENIRTYITTNKHDEFETDQKILTEMLRFLDSGLDNILGTIEKNIGILNNLLKFTEDNLNSTTSPNQESVSFKDPIYLHYFNEADEKEEPTKIVDNKDENQSGNGEQKEKGKNISSKLTYIIKVNTEILAAQTALTDTISALYVNILNKYLAGAPSTEEKKEGNPSQKPEDTQIKRGVFQRLK